MKQRILYGRGEFRWIARRPAAWGAQAYIRGTSKRHRPKGNEVRRERRPAAPMEEPISYFEHHAQNKKSSSCFRYGGRGRNGRTNSDGAPPRHEDRAG